MSDPAKTLLKLSELLEKRTKFIFSSSSLAVAAIFVLGADNISNINENICMLFFLKMSALLFVATIAYGIYLFYQLHDSSITIYSVADYIDLTNDPENAKKYVSENDQKNIQVTADKLGQRMNSMYLHMLHMDKLFGAAVLFLLLYVFPAIFFYN